MSLADDACVFNERAGYMLKNAPFGIEALPNPAGGVLFLEPTATGHRARYVVYLTVPEDDPGLLAVTVPIPLTLLRNTDRAIDVLAERIAWLVTAVREKRAGTL